MGKWYQKRLFEISPRVGLVILIVLIGVFVVSVIFTKDWRFWEKKPDRAQQAYSEANRLKAEIESQWEEIQRRIKMLKQSGLLMNLEWQNYTAYVDPMKWYDLTLEQKRTMAVILWKYFAYMHNDYRKTSIQAKICDSYSGTQLARASTWGLEVY